MVKTSKMWCKVVFVGQLRVKFTVLNRKSGEKVCNAMIWTVKVVIYHFGWHLGKSFLCVGQEKWELTKMCQN